MPTRYRISAFARFPIGYWGSYAEANPCLWLCRQAPGARTFARVVAPQSELRTPSRSDEMCRRPVSGSLEDHHVVAQAWRTIGEMFKQIQAARTSVTAELSVFIAGRPPKLAYVNSAPLRENRPRRAPVRCRCVGLCQPQSSSNSFLKADRSSLQISSVLSRSHCVRCEQ